jgi:alkyldihydroxyacetonephosphate synthase
MSDIVAALREALGERVLTDADTLDAHRYDYWALAELHEMLGRGAPRPKAVVRAASTEDVAQTLRICRAERVPVIPFGAASGCVGGIQGDPDSIVLNTRGLDGLVRLDDRNLTATFRSGTMGIEAEKRVQQDGLTIGHWPQSIEVSTVGGWVATRAAGQYSTAYGSIEDVVLALEVVLPDGSVLRTRETPRASAGPDLRQIFMGSEGTLGVITEVTFSLRPLPEASRGQAFHFATFDEGLEAIRRIMRVGWRPPVVRLLDHQESKRTFAEWCPEGRSLLLMIHEGPATAVTAQLEAVADLCRETGGKETDVAPVDHWLEHRNQVPSWREMAEQGWVVDTIEVGCTWDLAPRLYDEVTRSLREVPGVIVASSHSSHSYRSGTCLYFTFAARLEDRERMPDIYRECWERTMRSSLAVGSGISHHHGIGRVRRDWLVHEVGDPGIAVLRALKHALDPDGMFNPGVLIPPSAPEQS